MPFNAQVELTKLKSELIELQTTIIRNLKEFNDTSSHPGENDAPQKTAENVWKSQALSHFDKEEITCAKKFLLDTAKQTILGAYIKRKGLAQSKSEVEELSEASRKLSEANALLLFVASSSMMMLTPGFNISTDDTSGQLANRIQILEKSLDTLMDESKNNTQ